MKNEQDNQKDNRIIIVEEILYQLYQGNFALAEKLAKTFLFYRVRTIKTQTNDYFLYDANKKLVYNQPHFVFYKKEKRGEFWGYGYEMMVFPEKSAVYSKNGMFVASFSKWMKEFKKEFLLKRKNDE